MDWKLLVGKGVFGLLILVAWALGLISTDIATGTILALISIDEIHEGYHYRKLSMESKEA